ncbi:MAG: hypothetical protein JKY98_05255 [Gammaproteobacteria bacterium]|nr:hypothetical protein [Gammaproteobacteria bacterium]
MEFLLGISLCMGIFTRKWLVPFLLFLSWFSLRLCYLYYTGHMLISLQYYRDSGIKFLALWVASWLAVLVIFYLAWISGRMIRWLFDNWKNTWIKYAIAFIWLFVGIANVVLTGYLNWGKMGIYDWYISVGEATMVAPFWPLTFIWSLEFTNG